MTSTTSASPKPWYKRWWAWVAALVVLLVLISAIANLAGGAEPETAPAETTTPSAPSTQPTPEPSKAAVEETTEATPAGPTDDERNDTAWTALRDAQGGQEPSDVFASDPTLWYGWISGTRVEGANFYVTLQVGSDSPERAGLGERAAPAISRLLPAEATKGLNWVIVEDASNVVIEQTQLP